MMMDNGKSMASSREVVSYQIDLVRKEWETENQRKITRKEITGQTPIITMWMGRGRPV
jgi:hypothetical protein